MLSVLMKLPLLSRSAMEAADLHGMKSGVTYKEVWNKQDLLQHIFTYIIKVVVPVIGI